MTGNAGGFGVPWGRYGLITAVVRELAGRSPQLGKTVLQKAVYLLQELGGIDFGYRFQLYTYGPFAAELLQDLDLVEGLGGVRVNRVASGFGGFDIEPGENAEDLIARSNLPSNQCHEIRGVLSNFGSYTAKDLELRSTIVYVVRDLERQEQAVDAGRVQDLVHGLKPRFEMPEIGDAMREMGKYLKILAI